MKNSIILKFNLVFLTIFGLTISNAQILTNNGQSPLISNSNVLIDGSTNFSTEAGAGSYVGKGIIIPSVDLVNFAFDLTLADGSTFPTYFDGMIVYNNTTGNTLTTGNRSSLAISVAPGFYYFSNPNGASNSNVTGGVWKPLGGVTLTGTAPIAVTSGVISLNDSGVTSVKIANDAVISAKILDGTIENADISSTAAIADTKLATISTAGKVANSATTATAINTPSTIVLRDASGNFTAGTITGSLLGNATTATSATTSGNVTGIVAIDNGGTGAITASGALTNLGGQSTSNLSTNVTTDSGSTTKYPSISAVETYVGNQISSNATPDATTLVKGKIQLAGDLSGTAVAPTIANNAVTSAKIADGTIAVADLANDAVTSAKILDGTIATSDVVNNAITGAKLETNIALPGTASMTLPSGTTAQRPVTAAAGMSRYNTTDSIMEYYNGTAWIRPTAGTTYTGSTSTVLNGTSFERAALTGDVTAAANSNATTIVNDAVTSAKILNGTITSADLSATAGITNGQLANNSVTINGTNVALGGSTTITASPTNSTLASTNMWVGNVTNQATAVAMSGDAAMSNTGAVTIANNAVTTSKISDGSVTGEKLNQMSATSGQVLKWNGTSWVPSVDTDTNTTYTGSTSTVLNGTSFERAALTGDVTAAANSNATTIADNAVTSAKILDGTITSADLSATAGISNGQLANNSVTINGNSVALGGSTTITHNTIRGTVTNVSSTSYTLAANDYAVITNNATGVTITMPDLTPADAGRTVFIFNNNTAAVANSWGGVTPIGVSTLNQFRAMELMWTGTIWVIMGK